MPERPPSHPLIPRRAPVPPELSWLADASPRAIALLIDAHLAAERGELPALLAQNVVWRSPESQIGLADRSHDNIPSTTPDQIRQQNIIENKFDDRFGAPLLKDRLDVIRGPATLWFGRLSTEEKLALIRHAIQLDFSLDQLLLSSLRESLIAATKSVSRR